MSTNTSRSCYICLAEVQEDEVDEAEWVSPCRCSGTVGWVHKACILRWVRVQERQSSDPVTCPACGTKFILTPEMGTVVRAIHFLDYYFYPWCKLYVCTVMSVIFFDTTCTYIGVFVLVQGYGVDEAASLLYSMDIVESMTRLHLVTYSLFLICYVPIDEFLLHILQRSSRIPILGRVLPSDVPDRYRYRGNISFGDENSKSPIVFRGVFIPVMAGIVGNLFFQSVDSKLKRFLIGGFTVLALKSIIKMYIVHKQMVRRKNMRILPFEPHPSTERHG
ncbi:E3 ubiquitin-protein ligase MARCHF5-like [Homalodisca vitripennis]|uniref:E3 ubiquitin-protein ligase MARCHF5-like n=1 Tax=Homalodisca vitripennis TaxID=197043 RepID=UPI001EECDDEB|nr:E3 ubiquitin-protein ligase MARCHF5-like [Homalodisca vitripennis]XP_046683604.1 E3 ubiquitin-protein ligase MARCHF5-like [Homalodisca vitripennis]KAG8327638.1 E3 ubiquitin-protein ligase march5 [Homalodisca vitripennis]